MHHRIREGRRDRVPPARQRPKLREEARCARRQTLARPGLLLEEPRHERLILELLEQGLILVPKSRCGIHVEGASTREAGADQRLGMSMSSRAYAIGRANLDPRLVRLPHRLLGSAAARLDEDSSRRVSGGRARRGEDVERASHPDRRSFFARGLAGSPERRRDGHGERGSERGDRSARESRRSGDRAVRIIGGPPPHGRERGARRDARR